MYLMSIFHCVSGYVDHLHKKKLLLRHFGKILGQGQMDAEDVLGKPSVAKRALIHPRYDTKPPPRGDKPASYDPRNL